MLWHRDPVAFVRDQFTAEPDAWQADALRAVAREQRVVMSACKGPGKSCVLAWIVWWFLATRRDSKIVCLSITADNLRDNLWTELATWRSKSELLQAAFEHAGERITSVERPKTWWASARAFAKTANDAEQAGAIAGFHGTKIMVVLDEIGDYPGGVVAAAEAVFANNGDIKVVAAGNPTSKQGPLYRLTRDADWTAIRITGDPDDPKRSPRIDKTWAQGEIDKWGRDNPWVQVNILGEFPRTSSDQLIPDDAIDAASERDIPAIMRLTDARVWGLDPARFGDDEAALVRRQGQLARRATIWRGLDGNQLGDQVARLINDAERAGEMPDTVFVDVGGVGSSVFDRLRALGFDDLVLAVDFGGSPEDSRFLNKRAEMWWDMADWVKRGSSCIPNDPVLRAELAAPKFSFRATGKQTKFVLESKDDMKRRGVASPNRADALALTFAGHVVSRTRTTRTDERATKCLTEYDPLGRGAGHG